MQLNLESVKRIIGNDKDFLVYGFLDYCYQRLMIDLIKLGYTFKFEQLRFPHESDLDLYKHLLGPNATDYSLYKSTLTSLVLENYQRSLQNKPFIHLLFCVAFEDETSKKFLNLEKVANSHHTRTPIASVTDRELRRCYRLYEEATPKIKEIIEKTFHFVKVNCYKDDSYGIEKIAAFWQNSNWKQLWDKRIDNRLPTTSNKKYPWRKLFWEEIKRIETNHVDKDYSLTNRQQPR